MIEDDDNKDGADDASESEENTSEESADNESTESESEASEPEAAPLETPAEVAGLLGRKLQMTQIFTEDGKVQPVTVIEVGPCTVLQVKDQGSDGYQALQLGFGDRRAKRVKKPQQGHYKKAGYEDGGPAFVREVAFAGESAPVEVGAKLGVGIFEEGAVVDVTGVSKGRGFSGTIRRHGFHRGPATHGSQNVRAPGSIGMAADPARVFRGQKMPGQMGNKRITVKNARVVKVIPEKNLLLVTGGIPGPSGAFVVINKSYFGS